MDSGSTPVVGVFRSAPDADAADAALAAEGYGERRVLRAASEEEALVAARSAAADGYIAGGLTRTYAGLLAEGASVVSVKAPFGEGAAAEATMHSAAGWEAPPVAPPPRDPAPFSDAFGIPVLTRSRSRTELMSKWSFSDFIGWNFGASKAAPLSDALGLTVLVGGLKDRRTSFGMPMLSGSAAPFSSSIGMGTLTEQKRPWTTSFGMPLLSSNPTPLSSMFGFPVLTRKQ